MMPSTLIPNLYNPAIEPLYLFQINSFFGRVEDNTEPFNV